MEHKIFSPWFSGCNRVRYIPPGSHHPQQYFPPPTSKKWFWRAQWRILNKLFLKNTLLSKKVGWLADLICQADYPFLYWLRPSNQFLKHPYKVNIGISLDLEGFAISKEHNPSTLGWPEKIKVLKIFMVS